MPTNDRPQTLSERFIDFALTVATDDIPDEIMQGALLRVIDTVGVALASARSGLGTAASQVVLSEPGGGAASVWGSGGAKRVASLAGFANGMLAHGIEYDDTHTSATLHPGVVIVPTVLAVAEEQGSSGPDVLAAVALGYELTARLGMFAPGQFQRRGFHPTAVLGIFGATVAAARLMGVGHAEAVHAAGLAGSQAAGLMEYLSDGSDTKQIHPGVAAQGAIRSVQLALHGATGPARVLEGGAGVFTSFAGVEVDADKVLDGLGERWVGMDVATKPYPACHCVHAAVDAWRDIRDAEGLTVDDIDDVVRLTAFVPHWYLHLIWDPIESKRAPRSVYEARFSLPYAVARVVVDGELTLDSFELDQLSDPKVLEVAQRVEHEINEYETFPAAFPGGLRVEMRDGRVFEKHIPHNAGSVGDPITEQRLDAKFLDAASKGADESAGEALLAAIRSLREPGSSISAFTEQMAQFNSLAR